MCSQCRSTPAFVEVNGHLLCINCDHKREETLRLEQARRLNELNVQHDEWEALTGVRFPRHQIPQPTVYTSHSIRVDKSVVGAINTGHIDKLNVALDHIRQGDTVELADKLQEFTQAVVNNTELTAEDRNTILEYLSFLGIQATLPKNNRQPSIGKTVLLNLEKLLTNSGSLASLYSVFSPMLAGLFLGIRLTRDSWKTTIATPRAREARPRRFRLQNSEALMLQSVPP